MRQSELVYKTYKEEPADKFSRACSKNLIPFSKKINLLTITI